MTDNLELQIVCSQPYSNCEISSGFVKGHPVDTLFIRFDRPPEEPTTILLRPDEMAAVSYCVGGALWSMLLEDKE